MKNNPTAIIIGDLHLYDNVPEARIDNYLETRSKKIQWICDLQSKYFNPPILQSGDIFENWRCSHNLLSWCIENLPRDIITIPGNHDLPSLSIENYYRSPLRTIFSSKKISMPAVHALDEEGIIQYKRKTIQCSNMNIIGFPWGSTPKNIKTKAEKGKVNVAIAHCMVYKKEEEWPGMVAEKAKMLLRKLKNYDLIVTGHNHKAFTEELNGRILVNPGSIFRAHADQFEHRPRVYLYYSETNTIEKIYIPIKPAEEVLSKAHIEKKENKEKRKSSFVRKLNSLYEVSISYKENLKKHFESNPTGARIEEKVWEMGEKIK